MGDCFRQYQRGERQKASVLAFSLGVLLISVIHIYLVDAGVVAGFISTTPFAFLLMIILISLDWQKCAIYWWPFDYSL